MPPIRPKEELLVSAPGQFAECSYGMVHYNLVGEPQGKPLVLCVHGISAEGAAWSSLAEKLVALGYQVLMPDLYGRGWSDAAAKGVDHDVHLFTSQLAELLVHVAPQTAYQSTKAVYLLGTSMGGAIAAKFAEMHRNLIAKLVLVCPAGMHTEMPAIAGLVKLPGLGEALISLAGKKAIREGAMKAYADPTREGAVDHLEWTVARGAELGKLHPGNGKALLSTVRTFKFGGLGDTFSALGQRPSLPVLLVWGDSDVVVPFNNHERILKRVPHASFLKLENAGHVDMFCVPEHMEAFHTHAINLFESDATQQHQQAPQDASTPEAAKAISTEE